MADKPIMEGFDAFVDERLLPLFKATLVERNAGKAQLKKGGLTGFLAGAGLGLAIFVFFQSWIWALVAFVLVLLLGMAPGFLKMSEAETSFRDSIVTLVSRFLGLTYQEDGFTPPHFNRLKRAKLVPDHDRAKFTELVTGERHGVPFSMFEAYLESRVESGSGKNKTVTWIPVFFGQLLHIPYHRHFAGHTLIARDAGFFNKRSGPAKGLKRVGLVDPMFEKIFEVYSTDQVEGRYLVDPLFMEGLLKLERKNKNRELQAVFFEQSVMVSITGGDGFYPDFADNTQGVKNAARETAYAFLGIFDLVDGVIGNKKNP